VEARGERDGSEGAVRRERDFARLGGGGDAPQLGDAAGMRDVRLHHRHGAARDQFLKLPPRANAGPLLWRSCA
jgi:hypothetical protein